MHTCSCSGASVLSILSATRSGTVGSSDSQSFRMQQCVFDQVDNWIQIYTTMHGLPPPPFFELYFCTASKLSITVRASLPEWRAAAGHLHALRWGQLFQHREWRDLEHNFFIFVSFHLEIDLPDQLLHWQLSRHASPVRQKKCTQLPVMDQTWSLTHPRGE